MKSIFYVGATLMIGASIYGFVDYQKTSRKKEFSNMYKEPVTTDPEKMVVEKKVTTAENKTVLVTEKKANVKKNIVAKEESIAGIRPIAADEKLDAGTIANIEKAGVTVTPSREAAKVVKKKRKLNTKLFSRGAMDERYIEKEMKLETPKEKKESVKSENKEQ
ncbi:MAG: hypothetical protein AAB221_05080 [Bacteroidota bacterium]|mgnify:CR=1 FL=1